MKSLAALHQPGVRPIGNRALLSETAGAIVENDHSSMEDPMKASISSFVGLSLLWTSAAFPAQKDACSELATTFATAREKMNTSDVSALRKCVDDHLRKLTELDFKLTPKGPAQANNPKRIDGRT